MLFMSSLDYQANLKLIICCEIPAYVRLSGLIYCFSFEIVVFLQCLIAPAYELIFPRGLSASLSDIVYNRRPNFNPC